MSITDELRKWTRNHTVNCSDNRIALVAIADRIDAEHEMECKEQFACGAEHGIGASIEAAEYQSRGWVKLPVDADGVPIHVGDVMELDSGAVEEVKSMHYYGNGGWTTTTTHNATAMPSIIRHHHAPTVEDVLREFTRDWCNAACAGDMTNAERDAARANVIAEFAARLRMAGEE